MLNTIYVPGTDIVAAYNDVMDNLILKKHKKAATIAALLMIVAEQVSGRVPKDQELVDFMKAAAEYTALYFGIYNDKELIN